MIINFDPCVIRIKSRLSIAGSYLDTLEKSLPIAKGLALDQLKVKAKVESWVPENYFMEEDIVDNTFEGIPILAEQAFIAYLHGIVETGLAAVCKRLYDKKKFSIEVKDIAGSPVEKAKTYLTKVVGVPIGKDASWQLLTDLAMLRNTVLHAGGEVDNSSKVASTIKRMERKYPGDISIKTYEWPESRQVHISLRLCRTLLQEVDSFFKRLFIAVGLERTRT
jgi:hypothetical protein